MIEIKPGAGSAEVIENIRTQLKKKIEADIHSGRLAETATGFSPVYNSELEPLLISIEEAHKMVGKVNPRHSGIINELIQSFKKLIQRILRWYTYPIIQFQISTIRFFHKIAEIQSTRQSEIMELENKVQSLSAGLLDLQKRMEHYNFKETEKDENYFIGGNG